jgi:hypothetical protein
MGGSPHPGQGRHDGMVKGEVAAHQRVEPVREQGFRQVEAKVRVSLPPALHNRHPPFAGDVVMNGGRADGQRRKAIGRKGLDVVVAEDDQRFDVPVYQGLPDPFIDRKDPFSDFRRGLVRAGDEKRGVRRPEGGLHLRHGFPPLWLIRERRAPSGPPGTRRR